jgi:transcriptional regulator of arginine metabolism
MNRDATARLQALRRLLDSGELSTQEELREKLEKQDFDVTQSTVSRDLKKLGAIRAFDAAGQTVYRLPEQMEPPASPGSFVEMIRDMKTNGSLIVIRTAVGSAPLIARQLDRLDLSQVMGTIAGDDTIFLALTTTSVKKAQSVITTIRTALAG